MHGCLHITSYKHIYIYIFMCSQTCVCIYIYIYMYTYFIPDLALYIYIYIYINPCNIVYIDCIYWLYIFWLYVLIVLCSIFLLYYIIIQTWIYIYIYIHIHLRAAAPAADPGVYVWDGEKLQRHKLDIIALPTSFPLHRALHHSKRCYLAVPYISWRVDQVNLVHAPT